MLQYRHIKTDAQQSHLRLFQGRRRAKSARFKRYPIGPRLILLFLFWFHFSSDSRSQPFIYKKFVIEDKISPKSIVSSGTGYFAAQNMMYRHTVTIYNKNGELLARIPDQVDLKKFGFTEYTDDQYLGGPVEACFSDNGKFLWVSNYNMIGSGFDNPGCDACNGKNYDPGFVYKINMESYQIDHVIEVGAVPKYIAISPDQKIMLVSNWSSGDISVVDLTLETEIKRIDVGAHPRGIAIQSNSQKAYVTIMGSTKIACIDLVNYEVSYLENFGKSPRHVVISENDSLLYVSINSGNCLIKYNLHTKEKTSCATNPGPRSMVLSPNQKFIYVVNYFSNTFSKIATDSMQVVEVVETGHHPIGITGNWEDSELWVACYEGKIEIFKDFQLERDLHREAYIFEDELASFLSLFQLEGLKNGVEITQEQTTTIPVVEKDPVSMSSVPDEIKPTYKNGSHSLGKLDPKKFTPKTEPVPVETHTTKPVQTKEDPIVNSANCHYHVIVGSFSIPSNAVNLQKTVSEKGYAASLIESEGGLTYVSAACFSTRDEATSSIQKIFNDIAIKGWVLKN